MKGKDLLGKLAEELDEQPDPKEVFEQSLEEKKKRLDEGGVPSEKRPI